MPPVRSGRPELLPSVHGVCRTADLGIGRGYVKLLQIVGMTARLVGSRLRGVKDGVDGGDVVAAGMPRGWRMKRLNAARTGSPATTLRSTPLTASVAPKRFVRPVAVITGPCCRHDRGLIQASSPPRSTCVSRSGSAMMSISVMCRSATVKAMTADGLPSRVPTMPGVPLMIAGRAYRVNCA